MWIVSSSGSHAVAAPVAETRVRELVRCLLRWISEEKFGRSFSGFPLLLSCSRNPPGSSLRNTKSGAVRCAVDVSTGCATGSLEPRASESSDRMLGEPPRCHPFPDFLFLLRRVCLSSSESIPSMAMGFVLTAAIFRLLSITLLSRHNFNQSTFANLCRITCLSTAPIHDHATLILYMSHLDVRTCE